MDNYAELQTTIEAYLARADLKEMVPTFVRLCEKEIAAICKVRLQDHEAVGNLVPDQDWIPLPDDYIDGRFLRIMSDPVRSLEVVSARKWQDVANHKSTTEPNACFVHGERIYVGRTPAAATEYRLFYRRGFPTLRGNESNYILQEWPMVYLYGSLQEAGGAMGEDERVPGWERRALMWFKRLKKAEFRAKSGNGPLRVRPDTLGNPSAAGVRGWPW